MIYRLEAPHINEARDEKMDELEALMAMNEKKVRTALRDLSRLTDRYDRKIIGENVVGLCEIHAGAWGGGQIIQDEHEHKITAALPGPETEGSGAV